MGNYFLFVTGLNWLTEELQYLALLHLLHFSTLEKTVVLPFDW